MPEKNKTFTGKQTFRGTVTQTYVDGKCVGQKFEIDWDTIESFDNEGKSIEVSDDAYSPLPCKLEAVKQNTNYSESQEIL